MKRYGDLYEKICAADNLYHAHLKARRGKRWYKEVRDIDEHPLWYIQTLHEILEARAYHTSSYTVFTRNDGVKEREIYKLPYYPDRIVHWAIIQVIEPILISQFTADTYSAIPGRGIHYGMKRVQNDLKTDPEGCEYCLKLDIRKYYPSINHDILKEKYRKIFKDSDLLNLLDEIIDSVPEDKGVPIGNYLSQYSANFYLSDFDHWIKEVMHVKHYHRYMDDIVIFSGSKEYLHRLFDEIRMYLDLSLRLTIKDNWQIFPTYVRGVDFLGYRFFGDKTLLRKRTARNLKHKMYKLSKKEILTDSDICAMSSYEGWITHCDAYGLYTKYIEPLKARRILMKEGVQND